MNKEFKFSLSGNGWGLGAYKVLIIRKYEGSAPDITIHFTGEKEKDSATIRLEPGDALKLVEALKFMVGD